jgi:ADP-ribose pyrophosphatase
MDHKPWETLSTEVLNENPWTKFIHDEYVLPNGKKGDYYYMKTPVCSIMIVPVLPNGKIALVKQFRYLFQKESIEFPAGHGENGTSVLEMAKRELEEETGYRAETWKELPSVAPSIGLLKDMLTSFVATDLTQPL